MYSLLLSQTNERQVGPSVEEGSLRMHKLRLTRTQSSTGKAAAHAEGKAGSHVQHRSDRKAGIRASQLPGLSAATSSQHDGAGLLDAHTLCMSGHLPCQVSGLTGGGHGCMLCQAACIACAAVLKAARCQPVGHCCRRPVGHMHVPQLAW